MTLETFIDHKFNSKSLSLIWMCNDIIGEYDDIALSLRQLYYQLVARGYIANTERSYKNIGNLVSKAREAGMISWDAIEDRNRGARQVMGKDNAQSVLFGLEHQIIIDPWDDQEIYPEVWVEKDALSGTVSPTANRYRATWLACKGYISASEAWRAGHRMRTASLRGQQPVIIHLGDHDPSGLDMTRDNQTRASLFAAHGIDVEIRRIALNMPQIELYDPPPNPAKLSDVRAADYVAEYGDSSWELDALRPDVIADLVETALEECITDRNAWDEVREREDEQKQHLSQLYSRWDEVVDLLDGDF